VTTRHKLLATLALAVPLALAVAACTSASGAESSSSGGKSASSGAAIVIGATLSLTGALDAPGKPLEAGYEREIAAVNAAGGVAIGGAREKLTLIVLNNGSDPSTASAQANRLVRQDHAVALLGFATPLIVTPVAVTAEQLHVPFLTSLMPVEAFASADKTGWTYSWDLFYDEQQQAADAARALAAAPGDRKVALFTDDEPDSVVERPLYEAAFKADGLDVVGDYTVPVGTTDFSSLIADARANGAQLVAGQLAPADGVALWKQLKSSGFRPQAAFLTGASDADYSWQPPGGRTGGSLSGAYWSPGQASPGQLALITPTLGRQYAGSPDYAAAAVGYSVAEVLTDALAKAGSTNPGKLNAAISHTDARTTAGLITFDQFTHAATTASTSPGERRWERGTVRDEGFSLPGRVAGRSVIPGELLPVGLALFQERVPALGGLVGHVGEPGGLAREQLLADQPVVDGVERVLQHPLRGGALAVDLRRPLERGALEVRVRHHRVDRAHPVPLLGVVGVAQEEDLPGELLADLAG
jgi:branched-chain amino acid transport system substrate-binding protein